MREVKVAFGALASVSRLRILQELAGHQELNVSNLARSARVSQPLMSWHLRKLRKAGLVTTWREGRQVYCALNRDRLEQCQELLKELLDKTKYLERSNRVWER